MHVRAADGGRTWTVLYADGAGFPLIDVCFTDEIHGWAVSSSGTLVDFSDLLHGTVEGWDGDSAPHPITLTTNDGGQHWQVRR